MTIDPTKRVCWWCGLEFTGIAWCCDRCYPLKEEGYANAKKKGLTNYLDIEREVFAVLNAHGVYCDPSMPT